MKWDYGGMTLRNLGLLLALATLADVSPVSSQCLFKSLCGQCAFLAQTHHERF